MRLSYFPRVIKIVNFVNCQFRVVLAQHLPVLADDDAVPQLTI